MSDTDAYDEQWQAVQRQVVDQYREVARMARNVADVHQEIADAAHFEDIHELHGIYVIRGERSLAMMDVLGGWLNDMDAVLPDDVQRSTPIFENGRQMFGDD